MYLVVFSCLHNRASCRFLSEERSGDGSDGFITDEAVWKLLVIKIQNFVTYEDETESQAFDICLVLEME